MIYMNSLIFYVLQKLQEVRIRDIKSANYHTVLHYCVRG